MITPNMKADLNIAIFVRTQKIKEVAGFRLRTPLARQPRSKRQALIQEAIDSPCGLRPEVIRADILRVIDSRPPAKTMNKLIKHVRTAVLKRLAGSAS